MARVQLTVTDDIGRIISRIETAIDGVRDFRPVWKRIRAPWETSRAEMFRSQGRTTGAR